MTGLTVLHGRPEDVPTILMVQEACGLSPWTAAGYRAEIGRLDSLLLVCESADGNIVGFLVGRILPEIGGNKEREAEIYNIGTLPDFRGKGVGSRLIRRFIDQCKVRDVTRVWLEVRVSNETAISFYRRHGFARHSRRTGFYSNPPEDADVMYLRL